MVDKEVNAVDSEHKKWHGCTSFFSSEGCSHWYIKMVRRKSFEKNDRMEQPSENGSEVLRALSVPPPAIKEYGGYHLAAHPSLEISSQPQEPCALDAEGSRERFHVELSKPCRTFRSERSEM